MTLKDAALKSAIKPIAFVSRAVNQGTNYATIVAWLLHRAFKGRTNALVNVAIFSVLSLAGQAAGIAIIYWFAKRLESGGTVAVPALGFEFSARSEPALILAMVLFSVSIIGGAIFQFLSRRSVFNLVEARYAKDLEHLIYETVMLPDARVPTASRLFMNCGSGGLLGGARFGNLTTIIFCNALTGALGSVGAALFLFHIDMPLTLVILFAAICSALLLYPLTLRASRFAKERETYQVAYRQDLRRFQLNPSAAQPAEGMASALALANSQLRVMRISTELVFATQIGITIILSFVIYYLATEMMVGRQNWAILIAYIGALRLTLMGCSQAIRAYASVSRFYPQITRFFLFTKDMQNMSSAPLASVRRGQTLTLGTLANGTDVSVMAGERLALLTADTCNQIKFALMQARAPHSAGTLLTDWLNLDTISQLDDAALILATSDRLASPDDEQGRALDGVLSGKVTLIVYRDPAEVGSFGEKRLLVVDDGELHRIAALGGPDAGAAIEEFSLKFGEPGKKGNFGIEDTDDQDADIF